MIYDAAIIGTGPAGLSAAINLKLHEKSVIWFGSAAMSQRVERSEMIANYPGIPMVTGPQLNAAYREHARLLGLEITDRIVSTVMPMGEMFGLMAENEMYQAKTVLLATGVANVGALQQEESFVGRGVSYCATCDGFLYKGKTLGVICADKRFAHEVEYLAGMAEKVYLYASYRDVGVLPDNVELLAVPPVGVEGGMRLTALVLRDGTKVPVDGLFCMRNAIAPATLVPGLGLEGSHIGVNAELETNIPGCFAAGDCIGRPYQLAKAVGDGNVAAHSILKRLAK